MTSSSDESPLIIERSESGVYTLVLNRPDKINSVNMAMRDELWQALQLLRDDSTATCAIIRGSGSRGFSAGADISEFGTAPSLYESREARLNRDLWGMMSKLELPLIAAIHGYAYGAGLELSLYCDIRIATSGSQFSIPEVSLGYIPSAGGSQTISRYLRRSDAALMGLTGRPLTAIQAYSAGLIHEVVEDSELYQRSEQIADTISHYKPEVMRAMKSTINRGADLPLKEAAQMEQLQASMLSTGSQ
jgi:enoyl-CoA hydratase/carnithine racemase|tara:strand:- start:1103 stop:1843 length:741 start_codon:yes stop_codon:yes gene_type:complete